MSAASEYSAVELYTVKLSHNIATYLHFATFSFEINYEIGFLSPSSRVYTYPQNLTCLPPLDAHRIITIIITQQIDRLRWSYTQALALRH